MRSFWLSFVIMATLLSAVPAAGEEASQEQTGLIRVSAERLEADDNARSVAFYGKVKATQDGVIIYADRMTLYYRNDDSESVDRIEITGGVRIVQEDRVATADKGIFLNRLGQVLLTGNAEVHQGGNSIVGDEIIYYINESRSVVKSQPDSRVNATFRPGGEKQ